MTKRESAIRNPQFTIARLLFALLIVAAYFAGLTLPLVGPDEPRYAQVAREMLERHDWITPTLGGFNWFEKPALLYWLEITSYNIFGVSEFAARFGSVLFGLGTIASLWLLGKHVERDQTGEDRSSTISLADIFGLIAASTIGIVAFSHGASFDIILTFPMTAALVSYFIYELRGRIGWLASFYFFIGLALLAKGLVGIVFPFAIVGFYHLLSWRWPSRNLVLSVFWGTILAAGVAATWYLPMYLRHGYEFIDQFFIQHHFQRYTSNKYLHPQPFYFFFWVLPLMTIPWLPFFVAALWRLVRGHFRDADGESNPGIRSLSLFALSWIAVPLVFFSFSGSKLPGYILPSVPATVILTSIFVHGFAKKSTLRRYLVLATAAGTFVVMLVAVVTIAPRFAEADSVKSLFAAARSRGLEGMPIMTMHRISHNAEFYAAGPLLREADGKQKRLPGSHEVRDEMNLLGVNRALVMIPPEYLHHLTQSDVVTAEVLQSNEEWALVLVQLK